MLMGELERNSRLYNVFTICEELKIDDPIHWMNFTSRIVVDWWIAYFMVKSERESRALDGDDSKAMSPEDAGEYLFNLTKQQNNVQ